VKDCLAWKASSSCDFNGPKNVNCGMEGFRRLRIVGERSIWSLFYALCWVPLLAASIETVRCNETILGGCECGFNGSFSKIWFANEACTSAEGFEVDEGVQCAPCSPLARIEARDITRFEEIYFDRPSEAEMLVIVLENFFARKAKSSPVQKGDRISNDAPSLCFDSTNIRGTCLNRELRAWKAMVFLRFSSSELRVSSKLGLLEVLERNFTDRVVLFNKHFTRKLSSDNLPVWATEMYCVNFASVENSERLLLTSRRVKLQPKFRYRVAYPRSDCSCSSVENFEDEELVCEKYDGFNFVCVEDCFCGTFSDSLIVVGLNRCQGCEAGFIVSCSNTVSCGKIEDCRGSDTMGHFWSFCIGEDGSLDISSCNTNRIVRCERCKPTRLFQQPLNGFCSSKKEFCTEKRAGALLPMHLCGFKGATQDCEKLEWSRCSKSCFGGLTTNPTTGEQKPCNIHPCEIQILFPKVCMDSNLTMTKACSAQAGFQPVELTAGGPDSSVEVKVGDGTLADHWLSSSIMTHDGKCCPQGLDLDREVKCCMSGVKDASGRSDRDVLLVDLLGNCCKVLDAADHCYESGLDLLGVYGGICISLNDVSVCGNGLCVIGKASGDKVKFLPSCREACSFSLKACPLVDSKVPGGNSRCWVSSLGSCECFKSQGRKQSKNFARTEPCLTGYTWTSKGCIASEVLIDIFSSNGRQNEMEKEMDCEGICPLKFKPTESPSILTSGTYTYVQATRADARTSTSGAFSDLRDPWFISTLVLASLAALVWLALCFAAECTIFCVCKWCCKKRKSRDSKVHQKRSSKEGKPVKVNPVPLSEQLAHSNTFEDLREEFEEDSGMQAMPVSSPADERLVILREREEILTKDIVCESWLERLQSKADRVLGRHQTKIYGILKPLGEILLYKDMMPSGFGNVHINHLETCTIRDARKVIRKGRELVIHRDSKKPLRLRAQDESQARMWDRNLKILLDMFQEQRQRARRMDENIPGFVPERDCIEGNDQKPSTESVCVVKDQKLKSPPALPARKYKYKRKRKESQFIGYEKKKMREDEVKIRSISHPPPPLPPWSEDDAAIILRRSRARSPSLKTRNRTSSEPPPPSTQSKSIDIVNDEIWRRFEDSIR